MKARKHAFVKQLIEACVYDTSRNFFFIFQHSISTHASTRFRRYKYIEIGSIDAYK